MTETTIQSQTAMHWRQYLELCKPKVVLLIVFTAVVGMLLATDGFPPLDVFIFGNLGIGLAAASGAAVNHWVDKRIDALMERTKDRPLPTGNLQANSAIVFALLLCALSMLLLLVFVNTLTALLTLISMIGYAVIYTMFLKRNTPHNIVLGGAAGAAPPVLGWAAVTGTVNTEALLLFMIIFIWTPPHFWALAIRRRNDYAKAGVPMLPVTHGIEFTKAQVLLYTMMLLAVTLIPFVIDMTGLIYLAGAVGLG
ncbi:MAG: heme o synthase, partial [Gammaproteobacteria bacterium]|nr:heme o synthase [Gammaproteobacteria bacterium]